jgi:hypothetical protein
LRIHPDGRLVEQQYLRTVDGAASEIETSKLAFEPHEIGSPVDLGCRIPAKSLFSRREEEDLDNS